MICLNILKRSVFLLLCVVSQASPLPPALKIWVLTCKYSPGVLGSQFSHLSQSSVLLCPSSSTFNGQRRSQRQMRDLAIDLHSLHKGSVHAGPEDTHGCLLVTNPLIRVSIGTPTKCKNGIYPNSEYSSPRTSILKLKNWVMHGPFGIEIGGFLWIHPASLSQDDGPRIWEIGIHQLQGLDIGGRPSRTMEPWCYGPIALDLGVVWNHI